MPADNAAISDNNFDKQRNKGIEEMHPQNQKQIISLFIMMTMLIRRILPPSTTANMFAGMPASCAGPWPIINEGLGGRMRASRIRERTKQQQNHSSKATGNLL